MTPSIFPIKLLAYETPHYTSSPYSYRQAFLTAWRAGHDVKRASWFAFDVTILSRTEVAFVAYGMRDNLSGGIGEESWRGGATVPADLTREDVERAIQRAASMRRAQELAAEEAEIVSDYADEIRANLDASAA